MASLELKNKQILVVGLGKSGLAAAFFLKARGAKVTVSDTRSAEAMAKDIPALLDAGIMVEAGGHGLLTFRRQDLIVISPGVPVTTPEVAQAKAFGIQVIGELELASRFLQGQVVAITGSNGKTTTTSLVGKIFADAGMKTLVGGNIGLPVVELVAESVELSGGDRQTADSFASLPNEHEKIKQQQEQKQVLRYAKDDKLNEDDKSNEDDKLPEVWNVLEVSSFQLETIDEFRPKIAAVLNLTPDHLDRHGTFERYVAAKARITENQTPDDFLVLNAEDVTTQKIAAKTKAQIYWFSGSRQIKQGAFAYGESVFFTAKEGAKPEPVLPLAEIPLKGAHNVENVLAAVCIARLTGIPAESIRASVRDFKAVEHRLEFVAAIAGVEFYNDSKATNVDATMKAVASFPGGLHLILGGKDKDSDYTLLAPLLRERVKAVYTIGSAAEKIERELAGVVKINPAVTLDAAVAAAAKEAVAGEIVLLAPACSSFDQFENYEHRGRVFRDLVMKLTG